MADLVGRSFCPSHFERHSARSLLRGIAKIALNPTFYDEFGMFFGLPELDWRQHGAENPLIGYNSPHFNQEHQERPGYEGGPQRFLHDGTVWADPVCDDLVRDLFEHFLRGIESGTWEPDPNLLHSGAYTFDDLATICALDVTVAAAPDYEAWRGPHMSSPGVGFRVGVIYEVIEPDDELEARRQQEPVIEPNETIIVPHVFLVGERSNSYIFMLGSEWGEKFHATALKLRSRLQEVIEQIGNAYRERIIDFAEDRVVLRVPVLKQGEYLSVRWGFTGLQPAVKVATFSTGIWPNPPQLAWRRLEDGAHEWFLPRGAYSVPSGVGGLYMSVTITADGDSGERVECLSTSASVNFEDEAD